MMDVEFYPYSQVFRLPPILLFCPHCFRQFSSDTVLFRSHSSLYHLPTQNGNGASSDDTDGRIIVPNARWTGCQFHKIRRKDGSTCRLLTECRDDFGHVLTERVCPKCRASLPKEYGEKEIHWIGVLGADGKVIGDLLEPLLDNAMNNIDSRFSAEALDGEVLTARLSMRDDVFVSFRMDKIDDAGDLDFFAGMDAFIYVRDPVQAPELAPYARAFETCRQKTGDDAAVTMRQLLQAVQQDGHAEDSDASSAETEYLLSVRERLLTASAKNKPMLLASKRSAALEMMMQHSENIPALQMLTAKERGDAEIVFFKTAPQAFGVYSSLFQTTHRIDWTPNDPRSGERLEAALEKLASKLF